VKRRLGIPQQLYACHTAESQGYLLEGHVPADIIRRVLADKPRIVGVSVPGMPNGSPGMVVPGRPPEHYDIIAWDRQGRTLVYDRR